METKVKIGVAIISLNGRHHLERLMPSLLQQKGYELVIAIADNGSTDGTTTWLAECHPGIHVIAYSRNRGFAAPNNDCIVHLLKNPDIQYIACINNDTVLPDDCFERLIAFAQNHQGRIGALQTKIVSFANPLIIDSVGITINPGLSAINKGQGETDFGQYEEAKEIFGATGSAAIYTRKALESLLRRHGECFDADYFAYQDDVDLAFRLRLLGFSAWYVPGNPVLHVHSATGKNYSPFKSYHIHRNTLYTIAKNLPGPVLFYGMIHFIKKYFSLILSVIKKQGPSHKLSLNAGFRPMMIIVLKAWLQFLLHLPILIKKRRRIQKTRKTSSRDVMKWFDAYRADEKKMIYGDFRAEKFQ